MGGVEIAAQREKVGKRRRRGNLYQTRKKKEGEGGGLTVSSLMPRTQGSGR